MGCAVMVGTMVTDGSVELNFHVASSATHGGDSLSSRLTDVSSKPVLTVAPSMPSMTNMGWVCAMMSPTWRSNPRATCALNATFGAPLEKRWSRSSRFAIGIVMSQTMEKFGMVRAIVPCSPRAMV